jgi:hypothetical protein
MNWLICSHGIEPTLDWTHFLKIGFVVAGGGFYSYYDLPCIKLDKRRKECKKTVLCLQKNVIQLLKMGSIPCWVQFHAHSLRFLYYNSIDVILNRFHIELVSIC